MSLVFFLFEVSALFTSTLLQGRLVVVCFYMSARFNNACICLLYAQFARMHAFVYVCIYVCVCLYANTLLRCALLAPAAQINAI